jgi:transketolase
MRAEFARAMLALFEQRRDLVFITGDLGYMALEGVAAAYGERFINAGVAEQNAVSLAAGLARAGQLAWVYSMAVFTLFRPLEQIRNNLCLPRLPVKLVGNGGGYGYGIMGATHHALEDIGLARALPNMRVYVPLLASDVDPVVRQMAADPQPNYLRLNAPAELPGEIGTFAPWRKLKSGRRCVVVSVGPVVEGLYQLDAPGLLDELEIWSVGTFPLPAIPAELAASIRDKQRLVTLEEHYAACGLGEALSHALLGAGLFPGKLSCLHAAGYPSGRYGSQRWHQEESSLSGPPLAARLEQALRD